MRLNKLTNKVYYTDYEELRDRPALGYIQGDNFSIAIDAGHSKSHLDEFYKLLKDNDLPLPTLTIITHWHWDHSFAMHAVNGITIANKTTNKHLKDFIDHRSLENDQKFLNLDPSIKEEYKDDKPIIVETSDIEFENELTIDAGGIKLELFKAASPHTDDATYIYLPNEKILFLGDATSGIFPSWKVDISKAQELIKVIEKLDLKHCIGCHWPIESKEELIKGLEYNIKYNHL